MAERYELNYDILADVEAGGFVVPPDGELDADNILDRIIDLIALSDAVEIALGRTVTMALGLGVPLREIATWAMLTEEGAAEYWREYLPEMRPGSLLWRNGVQGVDY